MLGCFPVVAHYNEAEGGVYPASDWSSEVCRDAGRGVDALHARLDKLWLWHASLEAL